MQRFELALNPLTRRRLRSLAIVRGRIQDHGRVIQVPDEFHELRRLDEAHVVPGLHQGEVQGLACRVAVEEPQPDLPDKIGPVHRAVAAQVENFLPALPAEEPAEERLECFAGALPARYELKLPAPDPGDLRRRDDPVDQEIEPEVVDDDRVGVNDHEVRRIDLGKRKIERAGMHLRTGFARDRRPLDQPDPFDGTQVFGRRILRIVVDDDHPDPFEVRMPAQRAQAELRQVDGPVIRYDNGYFRLLHSARPYS